MISKVNHQDEHVLLAVTFIGAAMTWLFSHTKEVSLFITAIAAAPVIYERYRPIVVNLINKIKNYVGKNK